VGDLGEVFRRVRHAVLPELDHAGAPAGHGAQAVVGVGELQARGQARERRGGVQHQAAQWRQVGGLSEKPAAEREIGALAHERVGEAGDVRNAVLAVGIECDDALGRLRQRILDSALQRGALAEIEGVFDDRGTRRPRLLGGGVARAVVDHHH
jgi:hypothetical protein